MGMVMSINGLIPTFFVRSFCHGKPLNHGCCNEMWACLLALIPSSLGRVVTDAVLTPEECDELIALAKEEGLRPSFEQGLGDAKSSQWAKHLDEICRGQQLITDIHWFLITLNTLTAESSLMGSRLFKAHLGIRTKILIYIQLEILAIYHSIIVRQKDHFALYLFHFVYSMHRCWKQAKTTRGTSTENPGRTAPRSSCLEGALLFQRAAPDGSEPRRWRGAKWTCYCALHGFLDFCWYIVEYCIHMYNYVYIVLLCYISTTILHICIVFVFVVNIYIYIFCRGCGLSRIGLSHLYGETQLLGV